MRTIKGAKLVDTLPVIKDPLPSLAGEGVLVKWQSIGV
jgi:hypothetical protein